MSNKHSNYLEKILTEQVGQLTAHQGKVSLDEFPWDDDSEEVLASAKKKKDFG